MKILYQSCHSILEHSEIKMLTELGHVVFSMGAYSNGGKGHYLLPRPSVSGMQEFPEFEKMVREHPRTNLPQDLFDWADMVISMHSPEFINENWDKMSSKRVIFRSIGQSNPHVENTLRRFVYNGLQIIRMSKMERNIIGYLGEDALIPFYQDETEYGNWNGKESRAINMTQSLKGRRVHCHHDQILAIMNGFPSLIYGSGNDDLGGLNGGELPYDLFKGALRDNRAFVYGGTWPSPYTLSVQEAMMTGIPIVALGKKLAEELVEIGRGDWMDYYEMEDIITNEFNGYISNDINELREYLDGLLKDQDLAKQIGSAGRQTALDLWGKEKIYTQWKEFLNEN